MKRKCRSWSKGLLSRICCEWEEGHIGCHSAWDGNVKIKWNDKG